LSTEQADGSSGSTTTTTTTTTRGEAAMAFALQHYRRVATNRTVVFLEYFRLHLHLSRVASAAIGPYWAINPHDGVINDNLVSGSGSGSRKKRGGGGEWGYDEFWYYHYYHHHHHHHYYYY